MDVKRFRDGLKQDIKAELRPRKLLRTAFVPQTKGLLNPIKEVFQVFVALIAQIFVQAKLIPKDHPSAKGEAHGLGAIWVMIIDASSNVKFKRENIYQIVVFYGVVGMLVFGILDLAAFLMHVSLGHAHAAATPDTASLFNETNASDNGPLWINTLFPYANNQTSATGLPFALQGMLVTYNSALLALGTAFALYQVVHLFMVSAHEGKFGGGRYSQLHAPLRLVIGIGLLVPTSYGFNSAQLITIQAAKWGSGLASNVWQSFISGMTAYNTSTPSVQASDVNTIIQKLLVDETCAVASLSNNGNSYSSGYTPSWTSTDGGSITAPNGATETTTANSYVITFDDKPGDGYCGSITIPMQKSDVYNLAANNYFEQAFTGSGGILSTVWTVANDIYQNSGGGTNPNGAQDPTLNPFLPTCSTSYCASPKSWAGWLGMPTTSNSPVTNILLKMQTAANNTNTAYTAAKAGSPSGTPTDSISPDWTKAGYLFLKITHDAADEGTAQNPTIDVDLPDSEVMTAVTNASSDDACSGAFSFINFACDPNGKTVVVATRSAMKNVQAAAKTSGLGEYSFAANSNGGSNSGGGELLRALSGPLNTLYTGILNATGVKTSTDSFGQSIFDVLQLGNIIMAVATAFVVAGAVLGSTPFTIDDGLVLIGIGMAIFPVAFSLAIMVPLMPAGRFIFGLFTWILTLFEGIIAMPVVALISINFEGEGMFAHGKQGWFLLLQMMLRPVLMIFGLIGAVMIFDTMASFITQSVFGTWFALNTTSTTPSVSNLILGPVQGVSFVFQIIGFLYFYALTLYACANLSFGLINTIPDRILSWTGLPGGFGSHGQELDGVMQQASSGGSGLITGGAQNQIAIEKSHIRRDEAAESDRQNKITQARNEYSMGRTGDQIWNDAHSEYEDRGGNSLASGTAYDRNNRGGINGSPAQLTGPGGGGGSPSMDDMHGEALQMNKDRNSARDDLHGEAISEDKQRDANSQQFYDTAHGEAIFEDKQRTASAASDMNQAHGEGIAEDKQRMAAMDQLHGEAIEENKTR